MFLTGPRLRPSRALLQKHVIASLHEALTHTQARILDGLQECGTALRIPYTDCGFVQDLSERDGLL